jgi:hypothetical protein
MKILHNAFVIFGIMAIICIPFTSCTGEQKLPYVFEGMTSLGANSSSPVDITLEVELPNAPSSLLAYKVVSPNIDDEYASSLASKLGFHGSPYPADNDTRKVYVYTNDTMRLEITLSGRLYVYSTREIQDIAQALPLDTECIKIAQGWLGSHSLYPNNVTNITVEPDIEISTFDTLSEDVIETKCISKKVSFITGIGDYNVYVPGAKVVIGAEGEVSEATINISQLKEYKSVDIKSPDVALNILAAYLGSPLSDSNESKECIVNLRGLDKLVINHISLQYYYTSFGDYAQPIYVFEGKAYSQSNSTGEAFVGMVDAISR